MSSPADLIFATNLVTRLSHDLANVLLPLRAVADLPLHMRESPESIAQLWVAAEEAITQLTRISDELRSIASGQCLPGDNVPPHGSADQSTLPHCRVLVVEDQEVVRRAITFLLHEAGQSCDVADTGQAAAERLQLESFDLVLLDRNLPDMKAEQLAVQIHDRKPHLPLVLVTGDDVGGGVQGIRWTNGEGHFMAMLAKPITLNQVRWLLAEVAVAKKNNTTGERTGDNHRTHIEDNSTDQTSAAENIKQTPDLTQTAKPNK